MFASIAASRVAALPLTRTLTNPSTLSHTTRHLSRRSPISPIITARLLSSSCPTFDKQASTNAAGKAASSSASGTDHRGTSPPPEDDFKISFRDLGMNRTTKLVVYTVIGILGTMETIFWCKAIWRWWKGGEAED
ncbi:hypothetical protein F5Y08DRAFT_298266, partial [Xylaria arbuscula]